MNNVYNLDERVINGRVPKNKEFPFSLYEWESLEKYRISPSEKGDVSTEIEFLELVKTLLPSELNWLYRLITNKVSKETVLSFVEETNESLLRGNGQWDINKWKAISGESKGYSINKSNIEHVLYTLTLISNINIDLHRMFVQLKKMGLDVNENILNMRRFPLGNFKKAINELDRVLGNPLESDKKNALKSDVKEVPQIDWLSHAIPGFAKKIISGEIIFSAETYSKYSDAWLRQSEDSIQNVKSKWGNSSTKKIKAKRKAKATRQELEISAYINLDEKYFEFFGNRMNSDQVSSFVTQRENYITKIPGKVLQPEPPFSLEDWNTFKQNINSKRETIVSTTKNVAPRFSRLVDINPTNPNIFWLRWKQLTKAWAFKYLLVEFLRIGWLTVNDIQNYAVKVTLRQEIAFIENSNSSRLNRLNEGVGMLTSKINTKVNVKKATKSEGTPREKLSYEERRKRKAQKYLNYLDDQMYYENHYVRPTSTRQRHNDGGGWS